MILKQIFKTRAGVNKRVGFERAHSSTHSFIAVMCYHDGRPFGYSWTAKPPDLAYEEVVYRIEKVKRDEPLSLG